jgi:shikimate dehydrogenase
MESACQELAGARLIVNATPLGMAGGPVMPAGVLKGLAGAPGASVMDMVYDPLDTPLLVAARARGLHAVDGLEMLVGQARLAFRLFFGREPPEGDGALRGYLVDNRR